MEGVLAPLETSAVRLLGGTGAADPLVQNCPVTGLGRTVQATLAEGVIVATVLGTNVGILLQQNVFQQLPVGAGVTLLSTAPVMSLALARREGDHPRRAGVLATLLSVAGVALAVG